MDYNLVSNLTQLCGWLAICVTKQLNRYTVYLIKRLVSVYMYILYIITFNLNILQLVTIVILKTRTFNYTNIYILVCLLLLSLSKKGLIVKK